MKTRVEFRETFSVYGYTSPMINEASQEREEALLRENYEAKLKSILEDGARLCVVIWFVDEKHWFYHIGVTKWDDFSDEQATCVEVPGGYYAVGTVTTDVPALDAWMQLMKVELSARDNVPVISIVEQETRKYFENYIDEDGNYELWAPIVTDRE